MSIFISIIVGLWCLILYNKCFIEVFVFSWFQMLSSILLLVIRTANTDFFFFWKILSTYIAFYANATDHIYTVMVVLTLSCSSFFVVKAAFLVITVPEYVFLSLFLILCVRSKLHGGELLWISIFVRHFWIFLHTLRLWARLKILPLLLYFVLFNVFFFLHLM